MIKSAERVGQKIKELRNKANFTQEQLAAKLQISFQAVSKWEKGDSYPDIQQLGSLCDLFNVSMDAILNDSNGVSIKKDTYRVFEKIENEKGTIEISDINATNGYIITLLLHNKSEQEIPLKFTYFLLLDIEGNSIDPQKQNITNYDDDVVGLSLLHNIPSFIPPMSNVHITLKFSRTIDVAKLWINIPEFIAGVNFLLNAKAHQHNFHHVNMNSLSREEIVDYYNYHFQRQDEFNNNENYPKITEDILDELVFPKTAEFYRNHRQLFDDQILLSVATGHEYAGWTFIKSQVQDPLKLRELIKGNYKNIEEETASGHGGILKFDSVQDFMDQEIIEFIIKLRAKYAKDYRKWTLEYINDANIDFFKPELLKIKYITNAQLYESKVSNRIINEIIRNSDVSEVNEHQVLKFKQYYKDLVEVATMDFLLSSLPVDNIETLTKFKPLMSPEAWAKKKNDYFAKEQAKLDKLKEQI